MITTKDLPPPDDRQPVRRALLSVSDKNGLVPFARRLAAAGVELVSTGGTARTLRAAGLDVIGVEDVTGFPEILGGRVKTLHPNVHGGLLAMRNDPAHAADLAAHGITPIDMVVVNLYPFGQATAQPDVTDALAAENIDIGGPTMVRATAKNFAFTTVVTDPADYDTVAAALEADDAHLPLKTRRRLAHKAFAHTAAYDAAIADYFARTPDEDGPDAPHGDMPVSFGLSLPRAQTLRYGENPHQNAALYGHPEHLFEKLHGKDLSYNNLLDLSAALHLIADFEGDDPTVAILKHTNPCGMATAADLATAYGRAFATDRQSPFGGIVVVNTALDQATAEAVNEIFTEIIIAPEFEPGVLDYLRQKKNRRLVRLHPGGLRDRLDIRSVAGGLLVQDRDALRQGRSDYTVATRRAPTDAEWADLAFAWRVVKHVKSNAIVYARDRATLGIGAGQMSRIDASELAVMKGRKSDLDFTGCVVASDAFFPFPDGLVAAADAGAVAAIQPGGSIRDDAVIAAADERDLAMVFTGHRHFRH